MKHVTVYKNGNDIIMDTFNIIINNPENFKEFKRKLNVEDGKKNIIFPSLSKMKAVNKDKRFEEFGFWLYKPNNSIISNCIEKYWSDNDPDELNHISEHNAKELRWVFNLNSSKIKKNTEHKIAYAISIPGLFPLENGIFAKEIANEPEQNGKSSSSIHTLS